MRKFWLTVSTIMAMLLVVVVPVIAANSRVERSSIRFRTQPIVSVFSRVTEPLLQSKSKYTIKQGSVQSLTIDQGYILQQVNAERTKAGLVALTIDNRLVQTAKNKSQDMIDNNYFDHHSPGLGSPFDQMKRAGVTCRYAGENIAGNSSAAGAMKSWMDSPGNRANILNPSFTHIGIGVVAGGPYGMMLTQQFIG